MPGPKYVKDFEFPASAGFHSSGSDRVGVRPHTRTAPQRFAKGGIVRGATQTRPHLSAYERASLDAEKYGRPTPKAPPAPKVEAPKQTPRISVTDALRGKGRRQREQDLGLANGGPIKCYADGGLVKRAKSVTQQDVESGGKSPLRPGFAKGGRAKFAKGGDIAQDKAMISKAISKHVASPKPRGHGVR